MGKIEAIRHKVRTQAETWGVRGSSHRHIEDGLTVVTRLTGALVRALLVMVLIATPSLLLPSVGTDAKQMVALIALFLGALVMVEYSATYPSLVEFRHAPPFNRLRFLMLFITVFLLSVIARGKTDPTNLTALVEAVGTLIGRAIDFPYSPVRLVVLVLPSDIGAEHVSLIRTAAGISYLTSLLTLAIFVLFIRTGNWPGRDSAFNVWLNLPTFDPTAGGDVVDRLERDARVNIALGFLLPFLIPAVLKAATSGIAPITLSAPQMMIWTMAAWSFLPASLFMRGIAMGRVAEMIREKRRQTGDAASGRLATA